MPDWHQACGHTTPPPHCLPDCLLHTECAAHYPHLGCCHGAHCQPASGLGSPGPASARVDLGEGACRPGLSPRPHYPGRVEVGSQHCCRLQRRVGGHGRAGVPVSESVSAPKHCSAPFDTWWPPGLQSRSKVCQIVDLSFCAIPASVALMVDFTPRNTMQAVVREAFVWQNV